MASCVGWAQRFLEALGWVSPASVPNGSWQWREEGAFWGERERALGRPVLRRRQGNIFWAITSELPWKPACYREEGLQESLQRDRESISSSFLTKSFTKVGLGVVFCFVCGLFGFYSAPQETPAFTEEWGRCASTVQPNTYATIWKTGEEESLLFYLKASSYINNRVSHHKTE